MIDTEGITADAQRTIRLSAVIVALGFSAFVTQVVLMRELVSVLAGNELIYGIVLGAWLLLTGLGAWLGRTAGRLRRRPDVLLAAQLLVAVLPVVEVLLLRTLRNVVFVRGAAVGVTETVVVCLVLLTPYCLLIGYSLALASALVPAREDARGVGEVYFLDSVGGVAAGAVFSFVLVLWLDHFQILYVAAALSLACVVPTAWRSHRRGLAAAGVVSGAVLAAVAGLWDLDDVSAKMLYGPQPIVFRGNSPYGSLVVTETAGQYNFLENGVAWFSTHNLESVEETVHYAMAQRPDARRVLLISGGVSGTAKELLKYPARVDYVELDPLVLRAAREFLPGTLDDPRIEVIPTDGRLWLRQTDRRYDVILVDVPDPSTSQMNRFYTREFFAEAKRQLTSGGVLAFGLGRYENRISGDLARAVAVAHKTLAELFAHVLVIPTARLRFLASDGPLTADIAGRLEANKISVRLLTRRYLQVVLAPDRVDDVARAVEADAPINRDFSPILYYYHLRRWMRQFDVRFGLLEGALTVLLLVFLVRLRPVTLVVFASGFAASALEVVLLLGFQVLFGSLYHRVGLIVTMFMLGLAIGSFWMNCTTARQEPRRPGILRNRLAALGVAMAMAAVCLPPVLAGLGGLATGAASSAACQLGIYSATLGIATLTGLVFPLAAQLDFHEASSTASRLYTADYVGAALGALLVSTLLMPLIGVVGVCLLAAGLNLVGSGAVWLTRPKGT